jgi:hypothetical protein
MPARTVKWFELIQNTDELQQGDTISDCLCPVVVDPKDELIKPSAKVGVDYVEYDVVILTQSCDIEQKNVDHVVVAVTYPFEDLHARKGFMDEIRKRRHRSLYLMDPIDEQGFKRPAFVVDFRRLFVVPLPKLRDLALSMGSRVRMRSPFREDLSQYFGLYLSRVGLPDS